MTTRPGTDASLASSGVIQVVPDVSSAGTSAQLTIGNITSGTAYDDSITFSPSGFGLAAGVTAVWSAGTADNDGADLVVQNDGNVVIYSSSGTALWSTGTNGK
ncbi:MAG TPA: hypothetical protein VK817_25865 [Trebonia sp.]|jgi:hypothetical protein|nr:hypothetical protein [Trebonia sp.]